LIESSSRSASLAGIKRKVLRLPGGPLVGRVEAPHRLDLIAEEIEPDGLVLARGEQVHDRAANREFARVVDGIRSLCSHWRPKATQPVPLDPLSTRPAGE
jgi:hypothetical protein